MGKTTTTNVGLDISVLGSRVNLSVDFYNNESSNLLIKNKIPTSTGYSDQYQNIGAIRNRGVELVLNTTNIRTKILLGILILISLSTVLKYLNFTVIKKLITLSKIMKVAWDTR